jgi:hypothetical protein
MKLSVSIALHGMLTNDELERIWKEANVVLTVDTNPAFVWRVGRVRPLRLKQRVLLKRR